MTAEETERADRLFSALASAPRRRILQMLATDDGADSSSRCCGPHDVCACTFAEELELGAPTISHHMRILRDAGFVTGEKRGLWVYYRLCPEVVEEAMRLIASFRVTEDSSS